MRPFMIAHLKALNEIPDIDATSWLLSAESSINYLKVNSLNDEIVIYASASSILIHGVLAIRSKVTPADEADLQDNDIPMPNDSWCIQRVWGSGEGHRMFLELGTSASLAGGAYRQGARRTASEGAGATHAEAPCVTDRSPRACGNRQEEESRVRSKDNVRNSAQPLYPDGHGLRKVLNRDTPHP
jgi:hypothetical protein